MSERREYRPSCGAGSCASCAAPLGLDAVKGRRPSRGPGRDAESWYCSPTCAQGLPAAGRRRPAVAEPRLYHRPVRFHRKRAPKELRSGSNRG